MAALPAAIHREQAPATAGDPHAGPVPTPGIAFLARAAGKLLQQVDAAVATDIDLAKLLLPVVTFALEADLTIPIGAWMPAAIPPPIVVTIIFLATVVPPPTFAAARFDELATATTIDPQATAIHTPGLPANTRAVRFLADQLGIAPRHLATGKPAIVATTANRVAPLCVRRWCGTPQRARSQANQHPHPTHSNPQHRQRSLVMARHANGRMLNRI
jgi:hypothetical protein